MSAQVLIVEDNNEDFDAVVWAMNKIERQLELIRCHDGDDALDYLHSEGQYSGQPRPWPAVVILDLNLPGTDGREVLMALKSDPSLRSLPVIVMSTSANPRDVRSCYEQGANSYMLKPVNFERFTEQLRLLVGFWLDSVQLPEPPTEMHQ